MAMANVEEKELEWEINDFDELFRDKVVGTYNLTEFIFS